MESIFIQTLYHFFVKKILAKYQYIIKRSMDCCERTMNPEITQEKLHLAKVEVNQIGGL